ncbi:MAG: arginine--tRNA ligase [Bacteroidales bacterium]|nr:arginine--tRNA ligase [Bacteroidales bacterium]
MIYDTLLKAATEAIEDIYGSRISAESMQVQKTKKEFEGDFTIVLFGASKLLKTSPEKLGQEIGENLLKSHHELISGFNIIKGFLNLTLCDSFWLEFFMTAISDPKFGFGKQTDKEPVLIEFSSPNTNKPLHLGHIRNNLLGHSIAEILKANGKKVVKLNLVNDRGIHICKSMLAWKQWGNGETPANARLKGDHLVGKYYVLFDRHYKTELAKLTDQGLSSDEAEQRSTLMAQAREMLRKWENGEAEVRELWEKMNNWVYEGFTQTYHRLGINFDTIDYESETYLLGKDIVAKGVEEGKLRVKDDGSVWADLSAFNLDEKALLRSDGTSVYMTQDLGTACARFEKYHPQQMIYVVGNEQNHHFDVLKKVLVLLGYSWAEKMLHLSYGMVELPQGKMKSREGTVVDADDLMQEMYNTARETTTELGKTEGFSETELDTLFNMLGLGALKYFILKVDPRKTMLFNPQDSIDFNGNTGPFIQYTHARIQSVYRKAVDAGWDVESLNWHVGVPEILPQKEKALLRILFEYPIAVKEAGDQLSPAAIANYVYELAREYNQFYHEFPILREENTDLATFRLALSIFTGQIIKQSMRLLGIDVPDRM